MEFGHQAFINDGDPIPNDALEDDLEAALALSRSLAIATDNRADAFWVFQGVNPNSSGGKSLVHTPWGGPPERRIGYFTYRQMTSLMPDFSDRVTDVTTGAAEGIETVAFHNWAEESNKVYVNVVNATGTADTATLEFRDNSGSPIPFRNSSTYVTDATNRMTVTEEASFAGGTTSHTVPIGANSVSTFVVELDAYTVPVSELTYLRERPNSQNIAWDADSDPWNEVLVGHNGTGARGFNRGIMRPVMEFDLSQLPFAPTDSINSVSLHATGYRGTVSPGETDCARLVRIPYRLRRSDRDLETIRMATAMIARGT